ncbi:hypothetical protein KEM48_001463 [Puccinia striiformis f. sp. tritici PST-130]|nr:hypothetical protein KEM48_001463 [Puccinia striiformis f. sp. tritici PST-130]
MAVRVSKQLSTKFGCIVTNPETSQALHYVEKPESFLSEIIILASISSINLSSMKSSRHGSKGQTVGDDLLRLEQDVISPLADRGKLYVYETKSLWKQIKTAGPPIVLQLCLTGQHACSRIVQVQHPVLLRRRSPTIIAKAPPTNVLGPEIVEPCYIDETGVIDPSAKIGPNVSIGANVKIGFGVRSGTRSSSIIASSNCVMFSILSEDTKIGPWPESKAVRRQRCQ